MGRHFRFLTREELGRGNVFFAFSQSLFQMKFLTRSHCVFMESEAGSFAIDTSQFILPGLFLLFHLMSNGAKRTDNELER